MTPTHPPFSIRPAAPGHCATLVALIRELAVYERLEAQARVTPHDLGLQTLRRETHDLATPDVQAISPWRVYRQGLATNVLNPKVAVFFLAMTTVRFLRTRIKFGERSATTDDSQIAAAATEGGPTRPKAEWTRHCDASIFLVG